MAVWICLLRGVNVGGNKKVAMADLRALLGDLGLANARTLLQSGNAIFSATGAHGPALEKRIAAAIADQLGMDVKVLVRSDKELGRVVAANPFVERGVEIKQLHASFLSAPPPAEVVSALDPAGYGPDEFEFGDRVIYTRCPNGIAGSALPSWEKVLGVTVTARSWSTVLKLAA